MNALTHAFPERQDTNTVRIDARPAEPGSGTTELVVSDNGVGVSTEYLSRLTEPFFTTRRGRGGTGLGLHIVYNIVTGALGGQMSYSSTPGEGLVFRIILPSLTPHEEGITP
jgi:signal transduction histidine kinase